MGVHISDRQFRFIVQLPSVRRRLRFVADRIAARTQANLTAAGVDTHAAVEAGTRHGGRTYARVSHGDPFGEYGTHEITRHRALGRAIK